MLLFCFLLFSEFRFSEVKPHGALEWTNHGPPRHYRQPVMHADSLPCIWLGATPGDVANPKWFTHDHRA